MLFKVLKDFSSPLTGPVVEGDLVDIDQQKGEEMCRLGLFKKHEEEKIKFETKPNKHAPKVDEE
jgi:hypothetical protein